jgi:hypothetical protein
MVIGLAMVGCHHDSPVSPSSTSVSTLSISDDCATAQAKAATASPDISKQMTAIALGTPGRFILCEDRSTRVTLTQVVP